MKETLKEEIAKWVKQNTYLIDITISAGANLLNQFVFILWIPSWYIRAEQIACICHWVWAVSHDSFVFEPNEEDERKKKKHNPLFRYIHYIDLIDLCFTARSLTLFFFSLSSLLQFKIFDAFRLWIFDFKHLHLYVTLSHNFSLGILPLLLLRLLLALRIIFFFCSAPVPYLFASVAVAIAALFFVMYNFV